MLTDGVKYWFATPDKKGIVVSECDEPYRDTYDKMLTVEWVTHGNMPKYVVPTSIAKADQWHLKKVMEE